MAINYSNLANTANNLIDKFGNSTTIVTLIKIENGIYDSETGEVTNIETETDITVVKLSYSTNEIDGTNIQRNDLKLIVKSNTDIKIADKIEIESVRYNIINITPTKPGDTVTHFQVQARK